jgi:hypothetical protein
MRRLRTFVPGLLLALLAAPATATAQGGAKVFRAGAATSNITPPLGEPIVGNWDSPPATHVHDELFARCLVLDDGTTRVAFAICDNVGVARGVFDAARKFIEDEAGIPGDHVLMAATHTHSATPARSRDPLVPDAELSPYARFLARRIADGVRRAANDLQPAEIAHGAVDVPGQVFNRRWYLKPGTPIVNPFGGEDKVQMNPGNRDALLEPAGPTDPQVSFVAVRAAGGGRPIALLANYSLHYVGGVPAGHVSADYFGEFAARIGRKLDAGRLDPPFVGILTNGTSGDVNNINFRERGKSLPAYEKIRVVAEEVAEAVDEALKGVTYRPWVPIAAARTELTLATRRPTEEQVAFARRVEAMPEGTEPKYPHVRTYAARVLQLASSPEGVAVPLQAIRLGDLGIAAIPFEVFTETGLAIKKSSPFGATFTIELANGSYGYLPTPRHHALGGYETWLGTNRVEVEASDKIERAVRGLLDGLKE